MKKIIIIIGLVVFATVTGSIIFLMTLDVNQYKPAIMAKVTEQTGREFNIEGDLEVIPSLSPTIAVSGISLGNSPWGTAPNLVEVGRIEAKVSLIPLISGEIHVNNFILHDTSIYLEKNAAGQGNWDLEMPETVTEAEDAPGNGTLPPVNIELVEIRNALLSYSDIAEESKIEFRLKEFTTAITDLSNPISFGLEADYNDIPVTISGQVGTVNSLTSGAEFPLDISGELGDLIFTANGSLANLPDNPAGSIAVTLDLDSLSDLSALSGSELPDQGPLSFKGNMNLAGLETLNLDEISLRLGEIGVSGAISVSTTGEVPMITANLQSDVLDLSPFMSEEPEEEVEFLFSRDALPLESLASINADLTYNASQIITPSVALTDNELTVNLSNGNLSLTNRSGIAGGNFSASLHLNLINNNQARLSTNISGEDIMLELLPHEEERWFTGGDTTISIEGTGSGASVAEIMGAFNGNILVQVGEATMPNSGIDLFGADIILSTFSKLNPLSSEEDFSLLECAVVNLPVNDGMISLDRQIAVQTSKMYMVGSGEINLKNEEINLGVRPYAKEGVGLNLSSVAGAAKIAGTLANPRPEFDATNAIKTGLSAGAAVATGGLSLLAQGLFSKAGADPEPCNTALGIVSQSATQTSQESDAQSTEQSSDNDNVVDDVKSTIRGLFGR